MHGVRLVLLRTILFAALWAVLTEGEGFASVWTLPGIAAGVVASLVLWPSGEWRLKLVPCIRFIPYFFWHSLLGGMDVTRRALSLRARVSPVIVDFPFVLEKVPARVLFLWSVSLLPGTAGVDLEGDTAKIHFLDKGIAEMQALRDLEERIAGLFGQKYEIRSVGTDGQP